MAERVHTNLLLDFYGPLLTENRQRIMALYCEEDMSLAEIAGQLGITRQGVSDALHKGLKQLEGYEDKLGLVSRHVAMRDRAKEALALLDELDGSDGDTAARLRGALSDIIDT